MLALLALLGACFGPSEEDENRLALYRGNSQDYFERGEYLAALQQAGKALQIDPDSESMQLMQGFCLLKLGTTQGNTAMVEEALEIFTSLAGSGGDDFRVNLGLGSASLARALEHDNEIERIHERLGSDFITPAGQELESARLEEEQEARLVRLRRAEESLREVLADELQKDNVYPLVDLVLVLNSLGGHDEEALALADRALLLLAESTRTTRVQLQRHARLDAGARVALEQRIENNTQKELALRDLAATVHYRNGNPHGFLEQMAILEERQLLGEVQYWNLSEVHEELGMLNEAIGDLEAFLRLRSRRMDYEQDEMAPEVFRRLDALRERVEQQSGR